MTKKLTTQWISILCSVEQTSQLQLTVEKVFTKYEKLRSRRSKYPEEYNSFLKEEFVTYICSEGSRKPAKNSVGFKPSDSETQLKAVQQLIKEQHNRISTLELVNKELSQERDKFKSDLYHVNSKNKDLLCKIEILQNQIAALKKEHKDRLQYHKNKLYGCSKQFETSLNDLKSQLEISKTKCKDFKDKCASQSSELCVIKQNIENKTPLETLQVNLKSNCNNQYTDDVRRTVICLQSQAGVSARNVSKAIQIVADNIFHCKFQEQLPCAQTVLNIVDEGLVISNLQVAEKINESKHVTLHSDGTSRDHKKVVGHQVTLDSGETLYLGFTQVASEDAKTLLELTLQIVHRLARTTKVFNRDNTEDAVKNILSKITSCMTMGASKKFPQP